MGFLNNLTFNIALFLVGAIFVLLGLTGGPTINNFSLSVQDIWARIISTSIGVSLMIIAIITENKRSSETKKGFPNDKGLDGKTSNNKPLGIDDLFYTRESAPTPPFALMLEQCDELWVAGKDCHTLLSTHFETIHEAVKTGKRMRFLLVNHNNNSLLSTMSASSITRPEPKQRVDTSKEAFKLIRRLIETASKGNMEARLADFLPTFTCMMFDGRKESGFMTIEYYGYQISAGHRLSIYLQQKQAPQTFSFYIDQFDKMWNASAPLSEKAS